MPYLLNERFLAKFTRLKSRKYHILLVPCFSSGVELFLLFHGNRHIDTTTVILTAHARQGLITVRVCNAHK